MHPLLLIEIVLLSGAIMLAAFLPKPVLLKSRLWTRATGVLIIYFLALLAYSWTTGILHGMRGLPDFYPEVLYAVALYVAGSGIIVLIRWLRLPELRVR